MPNYQKGKGSAIFLHIANKKLQTNKRLCFIAIVKKGFLKILPLIEQKIQKFQLTKNSFLRVLLVPNLKKVEPFKIASSKSELMPILSSFKFNCICSYNFKILKIFYRELELIWR